jgi:two-component system, cell cycle sensor histidine kinase and response regulator CckA
VNDEDKIRELEAEVRRLHVMLESAPDFIVRVTRDGKISYINRLAPGFCLENVVGSSIENYIPPQFHDQARRAIEAAYDTRTVQEYATLGQISQDRVGNYLTRVSPVVEGGVVTSALMTSTDVTALEQQRTLLQLALNSGNLGIWTFNPATNSGTWDESTRRIFGLEPGENPPPLPVMLSERIYPDDRERVLKALHDSQATDRFGPIEHRLRRPNGEVCWVSASGLTVRGALGGVVEIVGCMQDITERKLLEARLLEAEKLESIGRLAGGVAHDFNNMLTAILGNIDFASQSESLDEIRVLLGDIRVTSERSAALTAQLLAFARRQMIEPKILDLNVLIQRLDKVFRRTIGEKVRTELALTATGRVRADESQLEQVIMNLVTNARDAMPDGGVLRVQTRDVEFEATNPERFPGASPGRYVVMYVSDTGRGIAPEALPRVFEPFFTTRSLGTGLGLATCYGIVKQGGGHISVESELGLGTRFKVYLPTVEGELAPGPKPPSEHPEATGDRVLLIEDEEPVRLVVERTLRKQGYVVVSAQSAEEGLRVVEADTNFALLVTDVVLPGMSGRAFANILLERRPSLRVLYVSGYSEDAMGRGGVLEAGLHFLQKPFVPAELLAALRRVLAEAN